MQTIPLDNDIACAVAACVKAKGYTLQQRAAAEQHLRAVREAGRLLALIQRSTGGRQRANTSGCLTRYQSALTEAGITRETASVWQRVAAVPESQFEQFVTDASRNVHPLTIAELLRHLDAHAKRDGSQRAVRLMLSDTDYRAYAHQIRVLGDVFGTLTPTDTVLVLIRRAHDEWLRSQTVNPTRSLPEVAHHAIG